MKRLTISAAAIALAILPAIAIEPKGSFDRNLTVSGPVDLEARTHSGQIVVRAGDAAGVRVRGSIQVRGGRSWSDALERRVREIEQNPPIHQTGNTIRIDPIEDEALRRYISVSYEITAPVQTRLRSRTGSGSLTVEGLRGPVDANTGSGSVTVTGVGDELRAHTGSGSVRIEQAAAGPLEARTGSGSVNVRLAAASGFDLHADTGSGSVHVAHPMTVRGTVGGRDIQGKVRGGGPLVDVRTGSGSVRIE